jgi:GxxExxY protein
MIENIKDPRTHAIIGAAMEVHTNMGSGLLEAVYQECMEIELKLRKIPFISQPTIRIYYKKNELKKYYIPDFLVYNEVVVEIKAEKVLKKEDEAQLINSLKNSHKKVGLLINFGESSLKFKRFVN